MISKNLSKSRIRSSVLNSKYLFFSSLLFTLFLLFNCAAQAQDKFSLKENDILVYKVVSGNDKYDFIVKPLLLKSDIDFEWGISRKTPSNGFYKITSKALSKATRLMNYFTSGNDTLVLQTTIWISQIVFNNLKSKIETEISVDGKPNKLNFVKIDTFRASVNNKYKYFSVIYAETDKGNKFWILNDPRNPIILKMDLGWQIYLDEVIPDADQFAERGSTSDEKADSKKRLADIYFTLGYNGDALKLYASAMEDFRRSKNNEKINAVVLKSAKAYTLLKKSDQPFQFPAAESYEYGLMNVKIYKVLSTEGKAYTVYLDANEKDGIITGEFGNAGSVSRKEDTVKRSAIIGKAEIKSFEKSKTKAVIQLTDPVNGSFVRKGDLVELPAKIPQKAYRSIFYDLARLCVDMTSNDREPLYELRQILYTDSKELNDNILQAMVEDIHQTAEEIKPMVKDNPAWGNLLEKGRYKGISMTEAMEKTDAQAVMGFLRFVRNFPGKYMGVQFRIDETYATWLMNNCPISQDELRDSLLFAKNGDEFNRIVNDYKKDIIDGDFSVYWNSYAEKLSNQNKFADSYKVIDLNLKVAAIFQNENMTGWVIFTKANITDNEGKPEVAIELYKQAMNYFKKTNDVKGESYCINNIGSNLYSLSKYDESLKYFEQAYAVKLKLAQENPNLDLNESMGDNFLGIGLCQAKLSRYSEALATYEKAIKNFQDANTTKGYSQICDLYNRIGTINEKMGNYKNAVDYYLKAFNNYQKIENKNGMAEALTNIGYENYKLGDYEKAFEYYEKSYNINIEINNKRSAGFSKSNMAQMYWNQGKYDLAIKSHQEAIKLRSEANDKSGEAYSYEKLAGLYNKSGDPNKSIESYLKALEIYESLKDKTGIASVLNNIGEAYYNVKAYTKAIEYYEKSLKAREEMNTKSEISETLYNMGNVYYDDKNYQQAKDCYQKDYDIRKSIGDKSGQLYSISKIGFIAIYFDNDLVLGEKCMNEALYIAKEINSKSDIAYCYSTYSSLSERKGDYKSSLSYLNQALEIYKEIGDKSWQSNIYLNIGTSYVAMGEFNSGLEYYQKALVLADSVNNRNIIASANNSIGEVYSLQGEFNKSLEMQNKSLMIYTEVDNKWGIGSAYIALGNTYNHMGEYKKAISYYEQADSIYVIMKSELNRATPMNNSGTVLYWQGDYEPALKRFNEVHDILTKAHFEGEFFAIVKSNIGEVNFEKKQYAEAKKWLLEALTIGRKSGAKRSIANSLTILSKVYIAEKNFEEAKKALTEALSLVKQTNERDRIAEVTGTLGKLYADIGDPNQAISLLEEATKISKSIGSNKFLWEPLFTLGMIYKDKKDNNKSIQYLKDAAKVMEEIRGKIVGGEQAQKIFARGEKKVKIYETLVSLLIENGDIDGAMEYLEKSNNEGLKEQFGKLDIKFKDGNKNRALETEKDLKTKVDGMSEQLVKEKSKPENLQNKTKIETLEKGRSIAETEYTKFINETIKEQPDLANHFRKNVNPIEFRKVKRQIPKDIAVVAYLIGENQLYTFVVTSDTVIAKVTDIKRADLDMKINFFYSTLKTPLSAKKLNTRTLQPEMDGQKTDYEGQIKAFKKFSEELYNLLIVPIKPYLENKSKLAIIPNGDLYYLPFQVLGKTGADGGFDFFVKEKSIFYISSLSLFFSQKADIASNLKILAFGNADNSLPNAEIEVKDIQKIYPDAKVFIRENATKDKVKNLSSEYNTIHFATHGNLDYSNFQNSYLTLAPDASKKEDGRLTLEEIWQITNLYDCKLVTLSACNTAVGGETIQGWLVNPANAFLDAGVQTVIATLWQVNDAATCILMKEFYNNMKTMDKIDALRKAQETLTKDPRYVDPFYWADFVLVGDWR